MAANDSDAAGITSATVPSSLQYFKDKPSVAVVMESFSSAFLRSFWTSMTETRRSLHQLRIASGEQNEHLVSSASFSMTDVDEMVTTAHQGCTKAQIIVNEHCKTTASSFDFDVAPSTADTLQKTSSDKLYADASSRMPRPLSSADCFARARQNADILSHILALDAQVNAAIKWLHHAANLHPDNSEGHSKIYILIQLVERSVAASVTKCVARLTQRVGLYRAQGWRMGGERERLQDYHITQLQSYFCSFPTAPDIEKGWPGYYWLDRFSTQLKSGEAKVSIVHCEND